MGFRGVRLTPGVAVNRRFRVGCVAMCGKARRIAPQALPDTWGVAPGGRSPGIRREHPLHLPGDALIELALRCALA